MARTRGHLTDLQAAAMVAGGRLSHREAYLLVRSGVSARRARWAIDQEPSDVGLASMLAMIVLSSADEA